MSNLPQSDKNVPVKEAPPPFVPGRERWEDRQSEMEDEEGKFPSVPSQDE